MCEVTFKNFEEKYPQIIDDLQSASFLSIDCEFSGLSDDSIKCSLFDTPKERYKKLQSNLKKYAIIQMGLSTFEYDRSNNVFKTSVYNFYLIPSSLSKVHTTIQYQLESIDFLCSCQFDFNKLFYTGINYLNRSYEKEIMKMIEDGSLIDSLDKFEVQRYCSSISEWWRSAQEGHQTVIELKDKKSTFIYILHKEIRSRCGNVWTYYIKQGIKVKKVSKTRKLELLSDKEEEITLIKYTFNSILGFSRIMKEIENLKKPIVGHNCLMDFIMIYKQFYNPNTVSYKMFKQSLNKIFPIIYDTKHMSFILRNIISKEQIWTSNNLPDLYQYLKNGKGSMVVLFSPLINLKHKEFEINEHFHEAGFDSYCTGFCFVKMAHMFSLWDSENKSFNSMRTTSSWLLGGVDSMKNCLNISRGHVNHIVLNGPDPVSTRPKWLYIEAKNKQPLDISKISVLMATMDAVDIQILNRHKGLMAVSSSRQVKEILEKFNNHKEYVVIKYNFLKHSFLGNSIVASTIFLSSMLLMTLLTKLRKSMHVLFS